MQKEYTPLMIARKYGKDARGLDSGNPTLPNMWPKETSRAAKDKLQITNTFVAGRIYFEQRKQD